MELKVKRLQWQEQDYIDYRDIISVEYKKINRCKNCGGIL